MILQKMNHMMDRIVNLEKKLEQLNQKLDVSNGIIKNHVIRVKNNEKIPDEMILFSRPYNDYSPQKAFELYNDHCTNFQILDVSDENYKPIVKLDAVQKIPFVELEKRANELKNKTIPILVISENGIKSIEACKLLTKKGHYNINNISGGYAFWPGQTPNLPPSNISRLK